jgi:SPP1 family predicted phage head-tail adaptor
MPSLKSALGKNEHISLDDVCFLLIITSTKDELGQNVESETPVMSYCAKLSISRAEFSSAGSLGHKPQLLLVIDSDEYDNESRLEYDRTTYSIYKTFMRKDGLTELYCEVRAGG